jgi:hypothetical protein
MFGGMLFTSLAILCYYYSNSSNLINNYEITFENNLITSTVIDCVNESNKTYFIANESNDINKFTKYVTMTEQLIIADNRFFKTVMQYNFNQHQINQSTIFSNMTTLSLVHYGKNKNLIHDIHTFINLLRSDENIHMLNSFTSLVQGLHQYGYYLIKNDLDVTLLEYTFNQIMKNKFPFEFTYEFNFNQSFIESVIHIQDQKYTKYYNIFFNPSFTFTSKCQPNHFVLNQFQSNWLTRVERLEYELFMKINQF